MTRVYPFFISLGILLTTPHQQLEKRIASGRGHQHTRILVVIFQPKFFQSSNNIFRPYLEEVSGTPANPCNVHWSSFSLSFSN